MRIGAKKRPFYRVVAVDERNKRTGGYIELLGTYDPMTHPHDIKLKQDRIDHWVKQGAQMSDGFLRIMGKAPQRPPRKPKKEKKVEEQPAAPAPEATPKTEPTQVEAAPTSEESPSEPASEESAPQPEDASEPEKEKKDEGTT